VETAVNADQPAYLEPWVFANRGALHRALHEYTALLDQRLVQQYGEWMPGGDDSPGMAEGRDEYERSVWRQRSTIDAGLSVLAITAPTWYRLIRMYFCTGLSHDGRGWLVPMLRLGYRQTKKCPPLERCPLVSDSRMERKVCRFIEPLACVDDLATWHTLVRLAEDALLATINRQLRADGAANTEEVEQCSTL